MTRTKLDCEKFGKSISQTVFNESFFDQTKEVDEDGNLVKRSCGRFVNKKNSSVVSPHVSVAMQMHLLDCQHAADTGSNSND